MNPVPLYMMIFAGLLGYLVNDVHGAMTGLCIATGITLAATFISKG